MKFLFLAALSFLTLSDPAQAAMPQIVIGYVAGLHGGARVMHEHDEIPKDAKLNDPIYEGDIVKTDAGQSVEILFKDKTAITIAGKDGELTIDKYVYDPAKPQNNKAHYSILRASFEFVGGLLDKGNPDRVAMTLDFGSIGIRGTKILRSMKGGECWIYLEDGAITVTNDGGTVDLTAGQGTRMSSERAKAPVAPTKWSEKNVAWIKKAVHL